MINFKEIKQHPQVQYDINRQLKEASFLADIYGLSDAGTFIRSLLGEKRGWLRIDEQPPNCGDCEQCKECKSVLVYKKDGYVCGSDIQISNSYWVRFKNEGFATHWMPLPPPPTNNKEKQNEN